MSTKTGSVENLIGSTQNELHQKEADNGLALIEEKGRSKWYERIVYSHDMSGITLLAATGLVIAGYFGITGFGKDQSIVRFDKPAIEVATPEAQNNECAQISQGVWVQLIHIDTPNYKGTYQVLCLTPTPPLQTFNPYNANYLATNR